jgi:hypothetical protein
MEEFSKRVLSRHITSSNVLVVAPDAIQVAKHSSSTLLLQKMLIDGRMIENFSVGGTFLLKSAKEDHSIHAIQSQDKYASQQGDSSSTTLDEWWTSFDDIYRNRTMIEVAKEKWLSVSAVSAGVKDEKPTWILLAVFDSTFGTEDSVWRESTLFLKECTVTYIVMAMHSVKQSDGTFRYGGLKAAELLLQRRYKLQTLSVSHYHAENDTSNSIYDKFGPNALFQSVEKVKEMLQWGADAAQRYENGSVDNEIFTCYVFATQGLDLAISSPVTYLRSGAISIDPLKDVFTLDTVLSLKGCEPSLEKENMELYFKKVTTELDFSLDLYFVRDIPDCFTHRLRK